MTHSFPVLDTHTGGEITRIVMAEDIGLDRVTPALQLKQLRDSLDWVRRSLTTEPRGSAFAVGAVVTPPTPAGSNDEHNADGSADGSIVFFNNIGYLGMCGHGLIGVMEALRYRKLVSVAEYQFATPAGKVSATLGADHHVRFTGVPSWCFRQSVTVTLDNGVDVVGDVAYGGNWFFLTPDPLVASGTIDELMTQSKRIRKALGEQGITGDEEAIVDHVELFAPLADSPPTANPTHAMGCLNFVLCPGGHFDRSPCGTGTSAKLACLAKNGQLDEGEPWIQQSVTGSQFQASYQRDGDFVRSTIVGRAHVIADTIQVYDQQDELRFGFEEVSR